MASFFGRISSRSLLRLSGADPLQFLQGLFTNDLSQLGIGQCAYGCFLNSHGRVLYDALISRTVDDAIFVEVEKSQMQSIETHLKEYRLRRKVKIDPMDLNVCVGLKPEGFADPRAPLFLLHRSYLTTDTRVPDCTEQYNEFLFSRGVGEGLSAFFSGKSLPFEGNLDLLGGVSFTKGCYVGQELTHRTHAMLQTRKRLVPLILGTQLDTSVNSNVWGPRGSDLAVNGQSGGLRLVAAFHNRALGVLRFRCLSPGSFSAQVALPSGDYAQASVPDWWPERNSLVSQ